MTKRESAPSLWQQFIAERGRRIAADPSIRQHGNANTYKNWACRCDPCTAASASRATYRQRRKLTNSAGAPGRTARYRIPAFGREWLDADDTAVR